MNSTPTHQTALRPSPTELRRDAAEVRRIRRANRRRLRRMTLGA